MVHSHSTERLRARAALIDDVMKARVRTLEGHHALDAWPEIKALANTPQDASWHAEGDVFTHTNMVLAASVETEVELVSQREIEAVRLACVFHDIAKPSTTRLDPELNRIVARGHERDGAIATRMLLARMGVDHVQRRGVAELVGMHHWVKRVVRACESSTGETHLLDVLATRVNTRALWALEMADMRGRICEDREKQIETVQLFRMLCEEKGVWGCGPAPWVTLEELAEMRVRDARTAQWLVHECHRARMAGTMTSAHQARAYCHEHAQHQPAEVVVTVGISGSGKSTSIASLQREGYTILSSDMIRKELYGAEDTQGNAGEVFSALRERLRVFLRAAGRVVVDATNVSSDFRRRLVALCHDYRAHVKYWLFDVPLDIALERNRARERRVPSAVIEAQSAVFSWPDPDEAHDAHVIEFDNPLEKQRVGSGVRGNK